MSAEDDTIAEKMNWHWRNTMRPARFFNLDSRAALPFMLLLVYFRPVTIFLTIIVTVVFYYLETKGLTFPAALRALRVWMIGRDRPGWSSLRHRRLRDFG